MSTLKYEYNVYTEFNENLKLPLDQFLLTVAFFLNQSEIRIASWDGST